MKVEYVFPGRPDQDSIHTISNSPPRIEESVIFITEEGEELEYVVKHVIWIYDAANNPSAQVVLR